MESRPILDPLFDASGVSHHDVRGSSSRSRRLFGGGQRAFGFSPPASWARQHDRLAAGLVNLLLGRFAEPMGGDFELLGQFAVAQQLQLRRNGLWRGSWPPGRRASLRRRGQNASPVAATLTTAIRRAQLVVEAALRHPDDGRQRCRPGRSAIAKCRPATSGLCGRGPPSSLPRADSPTEPLATAVLLDAAMDVVEIHDSVTPRSRSTSCFGRS